MLSLALEGVTHRLLRKSTWEESWAMASALFSRSARRSSASPPCARAWPSIAPSRVSSASRVATCSSEAPMAASSSAALASLASTRRSSAESCASAARTSRAGSSAGTSLLSAAAVGAAARGGTASSAAASTGECASMRSLRPCQRTSWPLGSTMPLSS